MYTDCKFALVAYSSTSSNVKVEVSWVSCEVIVSRQLHYLAMYLSGGEHSAD